jgi:hypothetical protein
LASVQSNMAIGNVAAVVLVLPDQARDHWLEMLIARNTDFSLMSLTLYLTLQGLQFRME